MVRFAPCGVESEYKSDDMHHETLSEAKHCDNIGFNVPNFTVKDIRAWVRCVGREEQACNGLREHHGAGHHGAPWEIRRGYTHVLDCHTSHIACKVDKPLPKLDRRMGKGLEAEPESRTATLLLSSSSRRNHCALRRSWCILPLGRFAVRDMTQTVAVCVIKAVTRKQAAAAVKKKPT